MSSSTVAGLLSLLSVLGVVAILFRMGRSALRLTLTTAESAAAEGLAEISARRGDLTVLAERREQVRSLSRRRRNEVLWLLLLAALLLLPVAFGWAQEVHALAAALWLVPRRPLRSPVAEGTADGSR